MNNQMNNRKTMKYIKANRLRKELMNDIDNLDELLHDNKEMFGKDDMQYIAGRKREIKDMIVRLDELKERPVPKPLADYLIDLVALAFGGATMWFLWQIFQNIRVWVENVDKL